MRTKTEAKHTPTPFEFGKEAKAIASKKSYRYQPIHSEVWKAIQGKEPAFVVRAVNSHEALMTALSDMAALFHARCDHEDYFHNCRNALCVDNRKVIAQTEGHP